MTTNYVLSWSSFQTHTSDAFQGLIEDPEFADVTLACEEDKQIAAHKLILSASSPFFRTILQKNLHQKPLIFLDGVKHRELVAIIDFIYQGKTEVSADGIEEFMRVGRKLKIRGLEVEAKSEDKNEIKNSNLEDLATTSSQKVKDYKVENIPTVVDVNNDVDSKLLQEHTEDQNNHDMELVEEFVHPSTIAQVVPNATKNVAPLAPVDTKVCDVGFINDAPSKKEPIGNYSSIDANMEISDMLRGDLLPGLALTEQAPKSNPKTKRKAKDQPSLSYSCDNCDFKAAEVGNLRMHTFYKHGGKTYSCDKCDFKAQRQSGLKFHKNMKHGAFGK